MNMYKKEALHQYPFPSRRNVHHAKNGMVATSQPLAAQAGRDILKAGGNAVDAAIATAAALTVVEPTSNGIGGDAFAIVWMKRELHGLNASGKAPGRASVEALKEKGHDTMPRFGFEPVTVPGVPSAWAALSEKFGALPLEKVLEPAISFAEDGFAVAPTLAEGWKNAFRGYKRILEGAKHDAFFETFTDKGETPHSGDMWRFPDHAKTLRSLGMTQCESFYSGEIADKIDSFSKKHDGFIRKGDLKAHEVEWVRPLSVNYRGIDVFELPPNTQGMVALEALGILSNLKSGPMNDVDTLHKGIESLKLAFEDGKRYIGDHAHMNVNEHHLLDPDYMKQRSELIKGEASNFEPGDFKDHGTVYLATADKDGNMVSYIQSNYMGFGSGLVVPGTGIALQNRGHNFSLKEGHPNRLEPGKKPYHTIIPGFLMKDGKALGPFGVMGGFMQPQGHLQVVTNMVDHGLNPQAALDRPRWQWEKGKTLMVEQGMPSDIVHALRRKGHGVRIEAREALFGRGQIILRDPKNGVYTGGTEWRTDGYIAIY